MHMQSWDVWITLHKDTPEIREQNLDQKFVTDKYKTAPMFVKRNKLLNIQVGT